LGNFITVKDFLNKYSADTLKLFFLTTHYSNHIDFTWDIIEQKREALYKIIRLLDDIKKAEDGKYSYAEEDDDPSEIMSVEEFTKEANDIRKRFAFRMDDNFDTPRAIAVIFDIVSSCILALGGGKKYLPVLKNVRETILELGIILGLRFESGALSIPEDEINKRIEFRKKLKQGKLYKEADEVRAGLEKEGIILEDLSNGETNWRRKS
jgi:cysteinyl-tRNA synthetase